MKMLPSTKFILASLTSIYGAFSASAVDYTWTKTDAPTNLNSNWNDTANWSPTGVPNATTANATIGFVGAASPAISLDGAYNVNNLNLSGNGGNTITIQSGSTAGNYSLTIAGAIKKNVGSSNIGFQDSTAGRNFSLTANTLDFTTGGGGSYFFGRSDGGRFINSVSIANINMGAADASTSAVRFNVTNNYSLGLVTFSGTNTKQVSLINNAAANAGYARTATVKGLTQTSGTAATIEGSFRAPTSGTNAATLQIDTDAATSYSATTILSDGTGGTLALIKSGAGNQTLSGASTFSGTTTISAGTLLVSNTTGSGLGTSNVTINGGTLGGSGSFTGNVILNAGGTLAPGSSIESLGAGGVTLTGGTFAFEINTSGTPTADLLFASDANVGLSITSGVPALTITDLGSDVALAEGTKFTLISYTASGGWNNGIFSGYADDSEFTLGNNQWKIDYNDLSAGSNFTTDATLFGDRFVTLTVVPEPATWGLLAFSLTLVMVLRRRRA